MNYEIEILNLKKRIEELEKIIYGNPKQMTMFEKVENKSQGNRDKTKYMFEGKVYPKNRLMKFLINRFKGH